MFFTYSIIIFHLLLAPNICNNFPVIGNQCSIEGSYLTDHDLKHSPAWPESSVVPLTKWVGKLLNCPALQFLISVE